RIEAAALERGQLQAKVEDARAATRADQEPAEQLFTRVRDQEEELRRHQGALVEVEKQLAAIDRTIGEKQSPHEVLRQLNEQGEGLTEGSQALLKSDQFEFAGKSAGCFAPNCQSIASRRCHIRKSRNGPGSSSGGAQHRGGNTSRRIYFADGGTVWWHWKGAT